MLSICSYLLDIELPLAGKQQESRNLRLKVARNNFSNELSELKSGFLSKA
jgi:hypothetical protein